MSYRRTDRRAFTDMTNAAPIRPTQSNCLMIYKSRAKITRGACKEMSWCSWWEESVNILNVLSVNVFGRLSGRWRCKTSKKTTPRKHAGKNFSQAWNCSRTRTLGSLKIGSDHTPDLSWSAQSFWHLSFPSLWAVLTGAVILSIFS